MPDRGVPLQPRGSNHAQAVSDAVGLRSGCPARRAGSGVWSFALVGSDVFKAADDWALAFVVAMRANGNSARAAAAGV